MRVRSVGALVAVLASLLASPIGTPSADAALRPTVTVTPHTGLVDDEPMRISIQNWVASTYLVVHQCLAGAPAWGNNCDYLASLSPGDRGNLRVRLPADVIVDRHDGSPVDCRVTACELIVRDANGPHVDNNHVARVPLTFAADGPDPARPMTTAEPDDDLRHGDEVRVTGRGFPIRAFAAAETGLDPGAAPEGDDGPRRPVYVYQCRADPQNRHDCADRSTQAPMTTAGDFTRRVVVRSRIFTDTGATIDCLAEPCVLVASSNGELSEAGRVALAFDPEGPVSPPPTVTVTPDTDLVDGQVVTITAEHFPPNQGLTVSQCPPDAHGYYFFACKDVLAFLHADPSGTLTVERAVHAVFENHSSTVDCRVVTCSFAVTSAIYIDDAPRAPVHVDPEAPLVDPQLTASPSTGLVDRRQITVSGEGYFPTDLVRVAQCVVRRAHPDDDNCAEDDELVILDESEPTSFSTTLRVHRRIRVAGGWANCARRTCYVRSADSENGVVRGPNLRFRP